MRFISVSSLRVDFVHRLSNSSNTRRFINSLCWLISVKSPINIVVLDLLIIRA